MTIKSRLHAVSATTGLAAFACVGLAHAADAPAPPAAPPLPSPSTPTGVFVLPECPLSPRSGTNVEAFPLAALLLPLFQAVIKPIVGAGVDAVANAIERRAIERSASSTARVAAEFYRYDGGADASLRFKPALGCVVVVRADFTDDDRQGDGAAIAAKAKAPKPNADGADAEPSWTGDSIDKINKALRGLSANDARPRPRTVAIASAPELYAEFPIYFETAVASVSREESKSKNAKGEEKPAARAANEPAESVRIPIRFSLVPSRFDYRVMGPRRGDEAKQVAIELSIAATVSGTDGPVSIYRHVYDFGGRKPGDIRSMPQYDAPWEVAPLPQLVKVSAPRNTQAGTVGATYAYVSNVPLVVTAVVTERGDPGDLERAIAESIRAGKNDIAAPFIKLTEDQFKKVFGVKEEKKEEEKK